MQNIFSCKLNMLNINVWVPEWYKHFYYYIALNEIIIHTLRYFYGMSENVLKVIIKNIQIPCGMDIFLK